MSAQLKYSSPTGSGASPTGGIEVLRVYDGTATAALPNQLTAEYDRASENSYTYDGRGRVTNMSRSLATPSFTSVGTIQAASNYSSNSFTRTFAYDGLDRLTGESTGADVAEILGADATGTGTTNSKSLVTGTYSARGVVASVQGSYGTLVRSNVLAADGAPLTEVLGDAAGTEVFRCYDGMRRVSVLGAVRGTSPSACAHAAVGGASKAVAGSPMTLIDDGYSYDLVGNPMAVSDSRSAGEWQPGAMPVGRTLVPYDDTYRLTKVTYSYATTSGTDTYVPATSPATEYQTPMMPIKTPANRVEFQTFAYDWLGNTTSTKDDANDYFQRSLPVITNGTATAGPNQLQAANSGPFSIINGKETGAYSNVSYDDAGHVTSLSEVFRGGSCSGSYCASYFSFEWDELGRLAAAQRTDGAATAATASVLYSYDASGHRVLRASNESAGVIYSAEVFPSLRLDHAEWNNATNSYEHDETTETAYLVFNGVSYGKVLYTSPANVTPAASSQHVFLTIGDALGSTSSIIDQGTGELVERATYYGYGAVESDYRSPDWQSFSEQHKYTGKEEDIEVGVAYFGARYYSPYLGRWMSPDPLSIHGLAGDPNPYAFVRGSPLLRIDPNGLDGCDNISAPSCGDGSSFSISGTAAGIANAVKTAANDVANIAKEVVHDIGHLFGGGGGGGGDHASPAPALPPPPPPSTVSQWVDWRAALTGINPPLGMALQSVGDVQTAADSNAPTSDRVVAGISVAAILLPGVDELSVLRPGAEAIVPSSRALAAALEEAGFVRGAGEAAHHIVAGVAPEAEAARAMLQRFGIGINDFVNGVFLPGTRAAENVAEAAVHSTIHTSAYYQAVNEALAGAATQQQVIDILVGIGQALQSGGFP
jgi:RHS repeat-associated protein